MSYSPRKLTLLRAVKKAMAAVNTHFHSMDTKTKENGVKSKPVHPAHILKFAQKGRYFGFGFHFASKGRFECEEEKEGVNVLSKHVFCSLICLSFPPIQTHF